MEQQKTIVMWILLSYGIHLIHSVAFIHSSYRLYNMLDENCSVFSTFKANNFFFQIFFSWLLLLWYLLSSQFQTPVVKMLNYRKNQLSNAFDNNNDSNISNRVKLFIVIFIQTYNNTSRILSRVVISNVIQI